MTSLTAPLLSACRSRARPTASGTSARSRCAATRCASSLGIVFAIWFGERRWAARGGAPGEVQDLAVWAVPFGLVGARLYHVVTDWEKYFGERREPGHRAVRLAGRPRHLGRRRARRARRLIGGARRKGIRIAAVLDVLAPGVIVAQAFGRWGNWFNQELYGKPTDLPWGLEIDPAALARAASPSPRARPSTPRSSTSASGTSASSPCSSRPSAASASATAASSPSTSWATPSAAAGSSTSASTPSSSTTSSACASTSGPRSSSSPSPRPTSSS